MRLLAAHGLRPDTDLGQHFLLDENLVDLAVRQAEVGPERRGARGGGGARSPDRRARARGPHRPRDRDGPPPGGRPPRRDRRGGGRPRPLGRRDEARPRRPRPRADRPRREPAVLHRDPAGGREPLAPPGRRAVVRHGAARGGGPLAGRPGVAAVRRALRAHPDGDGGDVPARGGPGGVRAAPAGSTRRSPRCAGRARARPRRCAGWCAPRSRRAARRSSTRSPAPAPTAPAWSPPSRPPAWPPDVRPEAVPPPAYAALEQERLWPD